MPDGSRKKHTNQSAHLKTGTAFFMGVACTAMLSVSYFYMTRPEGKPDTSVRYSSIQETATTHETTAYSSASDMSRKVIQETETTSQEQTTIPVETTLQQESTQQTTAATRKNAAETTKQKKQKETTTTAPQITYKEVKETVYTKQTANVRTGNSTESEIITTLKQGVELTRVAIGDDNWDKVNYDGSIVYVHHSLLTTQLPKQEETTTVPPTTAPAETTTKEAQTQAPKQTAMQKKAVSHYEDKETMKTVKELAELVNNYRELNGLNRLKLSTTIGYMASHRALEMADAGYISHTRPDGTDCLTIKNEYGFSSGFMGEVLGMYQYDAEEIFLNWMYSPEHNEILLHPDFTKMNFSVAECENTALIWVGLFSK